METQMELISKYLANTNGRDKLYRLLQFFCLFLNAELQRIGLSDLAKRVALIRLAIVPARKLFRVGKPIDFLVYFRDLTCSSKQREEDEVIRLTQAGRSLLYALYFSVDSINWFLSTKAWLVTQATAKRYQNMAARFWLGALICSWLSQVYRLRDLSLREAVVLRATECNHKETSPDVLKERTELAGEKQKIQKQLLQDSLDIIIPANQLGWIDVGPSVVGLAGSITSLMGMYAQWKLTVKNLKKKPS